MITIILCSVIGGIILTLLVQTLLFYSRFSRLPKLEKPTIDQFPPVRLPKGLKEKLQDKENLGKKQSCIWFNILSQYLFQELRDTQQVRRFLMKKMNREFEELLQTTSGKFLDQIIVRDFNLGTTFPIVNNVTVINVVQTADEKLEELDLGLEVDYNGGFQIALDVFLVLNKSAFLSVTMKKLKGYARLQLTRTPYTHWSFSFYEDPEVDFAVESHFEGRPLPQIANLIVSQLRRSIRKKHTLPNYKMRFKPFFFQPEPEKPLRDLTVNGHNIITGKLEVTVVECSRLLKTPKDSFLYCSLSIGTTIFI
ncbi:PDZ domain-containing protein 8 [Patella vulgata]|uniref:PDZ domain-containing protein 8 n=1 Tax=Patella vulgata TaxID=6465 RepID=UPI00217F7FE0|nr:PDZ domain-containing protein 8 [Patella vulgata]